MRRSLFAFALAALLTSPAAGQISPFPAGPTNQSNLALIAPTPASPTENNNRIATTAWVNNFVGAGLPLSSGKIWIGSVGNIATPQTPSGDLTVSNAGVFTFGTVNANVGSFGSVTQCASVTVNAKGLVTAASQNVCTPAIASVTGLGTGVATALAVNIGSAGAPVLFNGALGTPTSGTLTNVSGLPITALTGFGAGMATWLATPSSANLANALTDETGNGAAVFANSPALAGTPTAPTAAVDTNTTQIATTAMVLAQAAAATPLANSTAAVGTSTRYARGDHVHPAPAYFSASLSANSSALSSGVFTKVQFDSELADASGWYDNATNFRFTPLVAGKYRISGCVQGGGTTVSEIDVDIRKNGSTYSRTLNLASGPATSTCINHIVAFNGSTDFVELFGNVTGTGTLNFLGGTAPIRSWFEGQYVGP